MKRWAMLLLIAALTLTLGCGREPEELAAPPVAYSGIDTTDFLQLRMVLVGDEPSDAAIVHGALSERVREVINASLSIRYLSWADYQLKYSLTLAGAEQLDLIYTSDWCYYQAEAAKGAFYELTEGFVRTYMPRTAQSLPSAAFEQARIGGRLYMITSSGPGVEGESWIAIRGDLREKHGLPPIETIEDLEAYLLTIARSEPGVTPYDAAGTVPLFHILYEQRHNLATVATGYPWITQYVSDDYLPQSGDIRFRYFTPEYLEFAQTMKQYADWGFWSPAALSVARQTRSSFENGTSASLIWNQTIFQAGANLEANNPDWYAEYIDLYPDTIRRLTAYTNDGTAIAAFSRHPERAAMCIDVLKNDLAVNDLFKGGIEGVHWIDAGEGLYTPGPDAERYPWNHAQWAFNLPRAMARQSTERTQLEIDFEKEQYEKVVDPAFGNFRFDHSPVKGEWATILALETEYKRMLELGVTDDPAATIEEFRARLVAAGFEKVEREFFSQYEAWRAQKAPAG